MNQSGYYLPCSTPSYYSPDGGPDADDARDAIGAALASDEETLVTLTLARYVVQE